MARRKDQRDQVVEITSAPQSPRDELDRRERRYLIAMAARAVCFIGAVLTFQYSAPLAIVLLIASLILPTVAVVIANSASPRVAGSPEAPGLHHRELNPGEGDQ